MVVNAGIFDVHTCGKQVDYYNYYTITHKSTPEPSAVLYMLPPSFRYDHLKSWEDQKRSAHYHNPADKPGLVQSSHSSYSRSWPQHKHH